MQTAATEPGRTAPSSKPVHVTETYTATLPAMGYVRLPVAPAICGVADAINWTWTAQDRSPESVTNYPRVQNMTVSDVCPWLVDPVAGIPQTRRDAKPWPIRRTPQARHHSRPNRKTQLTF